MNAKRFPALTTLGLSLCGLAMAIPATASARDDSPGIYLGGGIGYNRIDSQDFPSNDDDIEDSRVSYKGMAGIRLSELLAIEGQYIDFGTAEDGNNNVKADGWTAGAVMTLPVSPVIRPYAKAGALFWEADGKSGSGLSLVRDSADGTDFTYGVGVSFRLAPALELRTEYERFEMSDVDVDMASANLLFNF